MKILANIFFILLFLPTVLMAYSAKAEISVVNRELKVNLQYKTESDNLTITLPSRARVQLILGSNQQPLPVYQNGTILTFSKLREAGKIINITYTLPIAADEFFLEEWAPLCSETGDITVNALSPQGYRFLIFPYEKRFEGGYIIHPEKRTRLIFGKYTLHDDSYNQQKISIFTHLKLQTEIRTVFAMIRTIEKVLFPLEAKSIDFITLPAWQNAVFGDSNQIVVIIGNTIPDAFKTAIAQIYFSRLAHKDWRNSLIDYYRRLIADDGSFQTDEGARLVIPSDTYYENVLAKGFPSAEKIFTDVNAMEKNYVLLHFGFFTIKQDKFHQAIRSLLKNPTNQNWDIAMLFEGTNETENRIIQWASEKLLPTATFAPDISLKYPYVYRNFTEIDIPASADGSIINISWSGGRSALLSNTYTNVNLDPQRRIPQWNYANDLWLPPDKNLIWEKIFTAAQNHKLLATDTTREILYAKQFSAPTNNKWNIPSGTPIYVVITRVYTTHQNRMTVALKEMIITLLENRPSILAYRLRL